MIFKIFKSIVFCLLVLGCKTKTEVKIEKITSIPSTTPEPIPPRPTGLKVSAYLIYDDGSFSSFDVLNDKSKALWNTIIGAGDAEKPSTSTKVVLTGQLDSLRLEIVNGKKKVVDQMLPNFSGEHEFIIKNTGCEIVNVHVTKKGKTVFKNNIEFHCGE